MPDNVSGITIAKNTTWVSVSKVVLMGIQFAVLAILAWLLEPGDFGLYSLTVVVINFLLLFNDFGLGKALIHHRQVQPILAASCMWTNLAIGIGLALLTLALAPLASWFFAEPELKGLLSVLGINFPIVGLGVVPLALLERRLSFRAIALIEICSTALGSAAAIMAAAYGLGVWSFVILILAQSSVRTLALQLVANVHVVFDFSWSALEEVIGFSTYNLGAEIFNYLAANADYILIGRFLGTEALGFYTMAYNLVVVPSLLITTSIGRVLFPILSRLQDDLPRFRRLYLRACHGIGLVIFPILFGLFAVANELIPVVFGSKWVSIVPVVRILAWVGVAMSISGLSSVVFMALGAMRLRFSLAVAYSVIKVAGIAIGISFGTITSVAIGYAIAGLVFTLVPAFYFPFKLMRLKALELIAILFPVIVASSALVLAIAIVRPLLADLPSWAILVSEVSLGAVVYFTVILVLDRAMITKTINVMMEMVNVRTTP